VSLDRGQGHRLMPKFAVVGLGAIIASIQERTRYWNERLLARRELVSMEVNG
jgi:hypothetical protein